MDETQRRVDEVRKQRSELENHIVDEYKAGKISRREFVRRGTVVGMSIPLVSFLAAACGGDEEAAAPPAEPGRARAAGRHRGNRARGSASRDRAGRPGRRHRFVWR